ncbi:MAG: hypothetical protein WCP97_07735 [bacterium]
MLATIITFLKKIGVISVGTQTYKGNLKDRPLSMIDSDISMQLMQQELLEKEEREKEKSTSRS